MLRLRHTVLALLVLLSACAHVPSDRAWYDDDPRPRTHRGMEYASHYLTMRDGVRIAIDVWLPKKRGESEVLPTIVHQTRYFRSVELRWLLRGFTGGKPFDHTGLMHARRQFFVERGYAWVDVDVRGSGASFGSRRAPWAPEEVRDAGEVVDWVVAQRWSNGKVGAMGISYAGTTAEMLLLNEHPAVRAVAPRFSLYDVFTDISHPGGMHFSWFTREWAKLNGALDRNRPDEVAGWWVRLVTTGVTPVQGDRGRTLRAAAVAEHADNYDVHAEGSRIVHRDDLSESDPRAKGESEPLVGDPEEVVGSSGLFSPHTYRSALRRSGAAVYGYTGWFDGAYPQAAVKRLLAVPNAGSRIVLGPWNHGGGWNVDPSKRPVKSDFDHDVELMRFFDHHLLGRDTGLSTDFPVRYYTLVEGRWKGAPTWPPPGVETRAFYLGPERRLVDAPPVAEGEDRYQVDLEAHTGKHTRMQTLVRVDAKVKYGNRARADESLLVYDTAPLADDLEVTGSPVATVHLASDQTDAHLVVYLEDVHPDGRVTYVTEGGLRALHRKVSDADPPYPQTGPYHSYVKADATPLVPGEVATFEVELLPTSYLFRAGHRIRLAVAGTDRSHFEPLFETPGQWRVQRSPEHPSRLDLPVMSESARVP